MVTFHRSHNDSRRTYRVSVFMIMSMATQLFVFAEHGRADEKAALPDGATEKAPRRLRMEEPV